MISDVAGKDCTKDFDGQGHSSDAKRTLKDLKIGELVEVNLLIALHDSHLAWFLECNNKYSLSL